MTNPGPMKSQIVVEPVKKRHLIPQKVAKLGFTAGCLATA